MWSRDDPTGLLAVIGPLATVVVSGYLLRLLPSEVIVGLAAWVVASLPVGVLIGHCALSEK